MKHDSISTDANAIQCICAAQFLWSERFPAFCIAQTIKCFENLTPVLLRNMRKKFVDAIHVLPRVLDEDAKFLCQYSSLNSFSSIVTNSVEYNGIIRVTNGITPRGGLSFEVFVFLPAESNFSFHSVDNNTTYTGNQEKRSWRKYSLSRLEVRSSRLRRDFGGQVGRTPTTARVGVMHSFGQKSLHLQVSVYYISILFFSLWLARSGKNKFFRPSENTRGCDPLIVS